MANSRHTIQNIAIDETMADQFNRALTKSIVGSEPLTVKGFPSLLLLDKNGQVKSAVPNDVTIIKSTTENLGNVPSIHNNENPKPVKQNSVTQQNTEEEDEEEEEELVNNLSVEPVEQDITMSRNAPVIKVNTSNVQDSQEEYVPTSMNKNVSGKVSPLSPLPISKQSNIASPPAPEASMGADVIIPSRKSPAEELSQKGGSLYGSIASAAYKLAPPAVLMAAAAAMMKRSRRNKKKGNRTKKSRRV